MEQNSQIIEELRKEQEEDIRQLALQTLEELYCMNCFQLHEHCTCMNNEIGVSPPIKEKPVYDRIRMILNRLI